MSQPIDEATINALIQLADAHSSFVGLPRVRLMDALERLRELEKAAAWDRGIDSIIDQMRERDSIVNPIIAVTDPATGITHMERQAPVFKIRRGDA